ncbi:MAG: hypothetical protein Q7S98_05855 [Deltaproteobacteria bacterium]|nr:hypothetical protein [Deltaproteobacteria bacterium]
MSYDDEVSLGSGPSAPLLVVDFSAAESAVSPVSDENSSGGSSYVLGPDPQGLLQSTTKGRVDRGGSVVFIVERSRRLVRARELMVRAHLESLRGIFSPENIRLVATLLAQSREIEPSNVDGFVAVRKEVEAAGSAGFGRFVNEVLRDRDRIHTVASNDQLFLSVVPWAESLSAGAILDSPFAATAVSRLEIEQVRRELVAEFTGNRSEGVTESDQRVEEFVGRWLHGLVQKFGSAVAMAIARRLPDHYLVSNFASEPEANGRLADEIRPYLPLVQILERASAQLYALKFNPSLGEEGAPVYDLDRHPAFARATTPSAPVGQEGELLSIVDAVIEPVDPEELTVTRGRMLLAHLHDIRFSPTTTNQQTVVQLMITARDIRHEPADIDLLTAEVAEKAKVGQFATLVDALIDDRPLVLAVASLNDQRDLKRSIEVTIFYRAVPWAPRRPGQLAESPFADPEVDDDNEESVLARTAQELATLIPGREEQVRAWFGDWYTEARYRLGVNAALDVAINIADVFRYQYDKSGMTREGYQELLGEIGHPPMVHSLEAAAWQLHELPNRGRLLVMNLPESERAERVESPESGKLLTLAAHEAAPPAELSAEDQRLIIGRTAMVRAQLLFLRNLPQNRLSDQARILLAATVLEWRMTRKSGVQDRRAVHREMGNETSRRAALDGLLADAPFVEWMAEDSEAFGMVVPWAESDQKILASPFAVAVDADQESVRYTETLRRLTEDGESVDAKIGDWLSGWYEETRNRLGAGAALAVAETLPDVFQALHEGTAEDFNGLMDWFPYTSLSWELYTALKGYIFARDGVDLDHGTLLTFDPVGQTISRAVVDETVNRRKLRGHPKASGGGISYRGADRTDRSRRQADGELLPETELPLVAENLPEGRRPEEVKSEAERSLLERAERDPKLLY